MGIVLNSDWLYDIAIMDLFGDYESTAYIEFGEDENNRWALVMHCVEEEAVMANDDDLPELKKIDVIYGKLAYQPKNSVMQEYDIDWYMPEIEGVIYDTEYEIPDYVTDKRVLLTLKDWQDGMNFLVKHFNLTT